MGAVYVISFVSLLLAFFFLFQPNNWSFLREHFNPFVSEDLTNNIFVYTHWNTCSSLLYKSTFDLFFYLIDIWNKLPNSLSFVHVSFTAHAGYKFERFDVKNALTLKKPIITENMKNENIDLIYIPLFAIGYYEEKVEVL